MRCSSLRGVATVFEHVITQGREVLCPRVDTEYAGLVEQRTERGRAFRARLFECVRRRARRRPLLDLRGCRPLGERGPRRGEVVLGVRRHESGPHEAVALLPQLRSQRVELRVGLGAAVQGRGLVARASRSRHAGALVGGERDVDVLERAGDRGGIGRGRRPPALGGELLVELFASRGGVGVDVRRLVDGGARAGRDAAGLLDLAFDVRERGRSLALGHVGDGLPAHRARLARDEVRGERVGRVRVAHLGESRLEIFEMRVRTCREVTDPCRVCRGGGFGSARRVELGTERGDGGMGIAGTDEVGPIREGLDFGVERGQRALGCRNRFGRGAGRDQRAVELLGELRDRTRHADLVELGRERGRGARPRVGFGDRGDQALVLGAGGVERVVQLEQLGAPALGGGARLLGGAGERGELPFVDLDRRLRGRGALPGQRADPVVDLEVQELREQVPALGRFVVEEPGELALREHDALGEVRERETEEPFDRGLQVAGAAGKDGWRAVGLDALEQRFRRARLAVADANDPGGAVLLLADGERERDLGFLLADAHDAGDLPLVAVAGHTPVQREAERVDHRRLACARRADEREVVDALEIDVDGVAEHAETLRVERLRTHQPAASAIASS